MRVIPFLIFIGVIALVGFSLYYFGGEWMMFSIFPFGLALALIAIKVENWWRSVRDTI